MDRKELSDRQFEALLGRLDRLCDEVQALSRRLDRGDELEKIALQLATLNESLGTLAYAALGRRGPDVGRRRTG